MIRVIVLVFMLVALTSCISKELRAIDDSSQVGVSTVTVIADGGASAYAPANTFASFDKAQSLGAVACRAHIQLSKDGQPMLFDDRSLDLKSSLSGSVRSHTEAELEAIDVAPALTKPTARGKKTSKVSRPSQSSVVQSNASTSLSSGSSSSTHLISLQQLFERYGMTFVYDLNLSGDDKSAAQTVLNVVKDYGLQDNVTLSSLSIDQLTQARQLYPKVSLSYVIDDQKTPNIDAEITRAKNLGFNAVAVRASIVTSGQVKRARALQLSLTGWDAKSDDDLQRAIQAGVAGLTTTAPDRLMAILKTPRSR